MNPLWWTTREHDQMRLYYPQMGAVWMAKKLGRTAPAIRARARKLKLKANRRPIYQLVQEGIKRAWAERHPELAEFEARVMPVTESGCWIWTGSMAVRGHGVFKYNGIVRSAARWAYEHFRGDAAGKIWHACGVPDCVNPWHQRLKNKS